MHTGLYGITPDHCNTQGRTNIVNKIHQLKNHIAELIFPEGIYRLAAINSSGTETFFFFTENSIYFLTFAECIFIHLELHCYSFPILK